MTNYYKMIEEIKSLRAEVEQLKQQIQSAYDVIDDLIDQFCYRNQQGKYVHNFTSATEHAWTYIRRYHPVLYKALYKDLASAPLEQYKLHGDDTDG